MDTLRTHINLAFFLFFALGAIIGFKRGWKGEAVTCTMLAVGMVSLNVVGTSWWPQFIDMANGVLAWGTGILRAAGWKDLSTPAFDLEYAPEVGVRLGIFALWAVVAYAIGLWAASGSLVTAPSRVFGAVLGCLNVFLLGSVLINSTGRVAGLWMFETGDRLGALGMQTIDRTQPPGLEAIWGWASMVVVIAVVAFVALFVSRLLKVRG
ncbi:MAG: hypothetical protein M1319_05335 [Chloroflexi bacterium]|nr:hypothetical protein [Chloroflexota bacterium]